MRRYLLVCCVFALALFSCDGDSGKSLVFTADAAPSGPALTLTEAQISSEYLTLTVTGQELTDCYGVAARITYDPEVLRYEFFMPASGWSSGVVHASRGAEGTLVLGITEQGDTQGNDFSAAPLGSIRFTILKKGDASISFQSAKTAVVDSTGERVPLSLAGGTLRYK